MSKNVAEYFACDVFNDEVMKARLPKPVYKGMTKTRKMGTPLDPTYADVVANAIKDWAIEHGATHYTHWFQPMTGSTAEKHDSFISPTDNGMVIMNWSRANRTLLLSRPAVCVKPALQEAIPHGIRLPTASSRKALCISRPYSFPTPVKHWTRKRRCCVPWTL